MRSNGLAKATRIIIINTTRMSHHATFPLKYTNTKTMSRMLKKILHSRKSIFHAFNVVWYALGVMEILLIARFILKLAGAEVTHAFASFVYTVTNPFLRPFADLVTDSAGVGFSTSSTVEWTTLVALIVYVIIAWGVEELLELTQPIRREQPRRKKQEVYPPDSIRIGSERWENMWE